MIRSISIDESVRYVHEDAVYTETRIGYNSYISYTLQFPAALSSRRCEISTFSVFVPTVFYNSSLLGVPKSTKLPQAGIVQQRRKIRRCRLPQRRWAMCNCIFGRTTSWVRKAKSIRACSSRNVSCFFFLLLRFLIGLVNLTCCPVCIVCSLGAPSASVDDE